MDPWIPLVMIVFFIAAWQNGRRIRRGNTRNGLRWPALAICLYLAAIYLLASLGIIPEGDIRLYIRWFLVPVGIYMTLEALYG